MKISEIMTRDVQIIEPEQSIQDAASLMQRIDTGALLVHEGDRLVGMVTDRDIVVRGLALGCSGDSEVSEVMTMRVYAIADDAPLSEAVRQMRHHEVRRLVVLDADRRLVGVISLGDLAEVLPERGMGELLGDLSEPAPSLVQ